jgi:dienelactone hydrolase
MAEADPLNQFIREQARQLRAKDEAPATRAAWQERREKLRQAMFEAMGPFPDEPCPLEPKEVGVLKRDGYRIEKLLLQTRPDVWMTATAYVPEAVKGKVPAVLVVHGHWALARRDPVVQARCLGLVKLGFFVLAVDAFGAGERHPQPKPGAYHGALLGSTLWPAGQSLLGMQVYDNRRAVDYLCTRPEVDADRLGVTGASGGGNQTMYAGALDERFRAVVPVCSVGRYQAYLLTACCVCEVLPGALRFTEEGDVLGLVAPRALLVINATQDGIQFSVGEARKSLERARVIFNLYGEDRKVVHATFESPHAYNQAMRETMYGWMTRWLKEEGDGKPIPEPKHQVDKPEDLNCFEPGKRPTTFVFPSTFAAREGERLLQRFKKGKLDHREAWDAAAMLMRAQLRKDVFGEFPKRPAPNGKLGEVTVEGQVNTVPLTLPTEKGLQLAALVRYERGNATGKVPAALLLHLDGKAEALKHPVVEALVKAGVVVIAPDLRGTGEQQPKGGAISGAPDHHSAEHGVWIGRPLLGQWAVDVAFLLDWMAAYPGYLNTQLSVVGLGQAGLVAVCAAAVTENRVAAVAVLDAPVTWISAEAYASGTRMGTLAPGILRVGDVPHIAALQAPRKLLVAGGATPQGKKMEAKELKQAFEFTQQIYAIQKAEKALSVQEGMNREDVATWLGSRE